ncbi:MAG: radical SAM protein [Pseudomonadota bacterium]
MDIFEEYLATELAEMAKGKPRGVFEAAFILREALKYSPGDPVLMTKLANVIMTRCPSWAAYSLAKEAYGLSPNPKARHLISLVEDPPLPRQVTFEVSTVCNLRCPLCENGSGRMTYPKKFMPVEEFKVIWDKLRPSTKGLILVGMGETFLHPDVYEILRYVKGTPYVYIDTNGNVPLDCEEIINSGIDEFTFSIDGVTQEMYERYRIGGNLERALRNVRDLVEAKRRRKAAKPSIVFKFVVFRHTEMYVEEAMHLAQSLGADQFRIEACTFRPMFGLESFKKYLPLSPNKHQRIAYVDFEKNEIGCPPGRTSRHCGAVLSSMMVTVRGEVSPCCVANHEVMFGNLVRSSLEDVWRSPEYGRFRLQALRNRWALPVCRVCSTQQHDLGRFFEGTAFAEPPEEKSEGGSRHYVRDNFVSAQEFEDLMASGRAREALYFRSIEKVRLPEGYAASSPDRPAGPLAAGPEDAPASSLP